MPPIAFPTTAGTRCAPDSVLELLAVIWKYSGTENMSCRVSVSLGFPPVSDTSTYPELCRALERYDGKREDGISSVEDLERQDRLLLLFLDGNKSKQKNSAEAEEDGNGGMAPRDLDAPDLQGQEQRQDRQGKQDGALEVDAAELALLADRAVD